MTVARPAIAPPTDANDSGYWRQQMSNVTKQLVARANNITEITLTNGGTTTTFTDPRITYYSQISFMPQTARAAGLLGGLYVAQATQNNGACVITHANPGGTDATFRVAING